MHRVSSFGLRGLLGLSLGRRGVVEEEGLHRVPGRRRALVRMRGAK